MTAIIDYGAGNLFSLQNALDFLGADSLITSDPAEIARADRVILPGVGAFRDAMMKLEEKKLVGIIKEQALSKPLLGICLGMQLLFDKSYEFGETEGLSLISGEVKPMNPPGLRIPHIGWNFLNKQFDCGLSPAFQTNDCVYFVHSYAAVCNDGNISAYCDYGGKVPAIVFNNNVTGCQFHPEKSGETGLRILKAFTQMR
jgi:glutamine amidotransferase